MSFLVIACLALPGCGESGKASEEHRRAEHPCQFSATSEQCKAREAAEQRYEELHHETRALHERARLDAERARLKRESAQHGS
jgi:hypothetical protein